MQACTHACCYIAFRWIRLRCIASHYIAMHLTRAQAYVPTCLRACVPTCLRAYVPTCLSTYLPTSVRKYVRTYLHSDTWKYIICEKNVKMCGTAKAGTTSRNTLLHASDNPWISGTGHAGFMESQSQLIPPWRVKEGRTVWDSFFRLKIERNNINLHRHSGLRGQPGCWARTPKLRSKGTSWSDSLFAFPIYFPIYFPRPNYTKEVKNADGSLKTVTTDKVEHLSCLSCSQIRICCPVSPELAPRSNLQRLDRWPEPSGSEFAFYLMDSNDGWLLIGSPKISCDV